MLSAQPRTALGRDVKKIRHQGLLPGVVYGPKTESQSIQVDYRIFEKLYKQAGESTLVSLSLGTGKPAKVLISSVTKNPVTNKYEHFDLLQVDLTEKIEAEIPLVFVGEPAAVKELGGVLLKSLDHVNVEALPQDLVHEISVDISSLKTFDDSIHVKDLQVPPQLTVLDNPDETVAVVQPPRSEAELEALNETVEEKVEAVEKIEKPKSEEAEEAGEKAPAKPEK